MFILPAAKISAERPVEDAARSGLGGKTFFQGVERFAKHPAVPLGERKAGDRFSGVQETGPP